MSKRRIHGPEFKVKDAMEAISVSTAGSVANS
jgi:hypothetical protein